MPFLTVRKAAATAVVTIAAAGLSVAPARAAAESPLAAANGTSHVEAGYALRPAPVTSSASTAFSVPQLVCPASGLLGIAPGAIIFTTSGSSTSFSGAAVFVVCQNGTTFYQAEAIVNGKSTALPVSVARADRIVTTVSVRATKVSVTFTDTTRRLSYTLTGSGTTPARALDGIDALDSGGTLLGVPNFGSLAFTHSSIDGVSLKAAAARAIDRSSVAHLQIRTGPLDATGSGFTETYKHS